MRAERRAISEVVSVSQSALEGMPLSSWPQMNGLSFNQDIVNKTLFAQKGRKLTRNQLALWETTVNQQWAGRGQKRMHPVDYLAG